MQETAEHCRDIFNNQDLHAKPILHMMRRVFLNLQSIIESDSTLEWSRHPVDEGFGLCGLT